MSGKVWHTYAILSRSADILVRDTECSLAYIDILMEHIATPNLILPGNPIHIKKFMNQEAKLSIANQ